MNPDVSVAPEIAQLMGAGPDRSRERPAVSPAPAGGGTAAGPAPTIGELARQLRLITAAPERWWGLVRFDPGRAVRISIPTEGPGEVWLMIIPPAVHGDWAHDTGELEGRGGAWTEETPASDEGRRLEAPRQRAGDIGECGCEVVAVVAGEVTEQAIGEGGVATTPLLPGRMRVHGSGQLHQVVNRSAGYTVSVHARARAS